MGECIITRAAGEAEAALPLSPGYHTIGITLRDPYGKLLSDYPIYCKDGNTNYNYKTNEKGQTIFMVNSGAANIFVNNYNGSYQLLDINQPGWFNIDAPAGLSTKININMNNGKSFYEFTSSKNFGLLLTHDCNIILVGGGGGGGIGYSQYKSGGTWYFWGGSGGGSGYMNQYENQNLKGNYSFIVGSGGSGLNYNAAANEVARSGGTSYISGTSYSAAGGTGGMAWTWSTNTPAGKGGLGNGGIGGEGRWGSTNNGESSPVSFAGGGGCSSYAYGGSPYGGGSNGYISNAVASRGGGGGAGMDTSDKDTGGYGGSGLMRINIHY